MIRTSFNQDWTYGAPRSLFASAGAGGERPSVTLPHDGLRDQTRTPDSPNGSHNGYYPSTHLEYRKSFEVPEHWRDKAVVLELEGAYRDAMVYVNGDFAAQRPNGYSGFTVQLDGFLHYGTINTVTVEVRTHEDSRWYAGAGLYRNTWIAVADPVHIPLDGVRITTPTIEPELATIVGSVDVINQTRHARTVRVAMTVTDDRGSEAASTSAPLTLRPGQTGTVHLKHYLPNPAVWDLDSPRLYTAHTQILDADDVLDQEESSFGIRSITVDPLNGLRLNGNPVKLRGGCIHHDNGPLGAAAHPRAEERRVQLLKAAGYNAVRSAHSTVSRAFLDAADRHGLLVWDETSDAWTRGKTPFDYSLNFQDWWERDVEAMVAKDFNHPSVILYSIGNEILEIGTPLGATWGRALAEKVRSLDSTRLVTNAVSGVMAVMDELANHMDIGEGENLDANALMNSLDNLTNDVGASEAVTTRTEEAFAQLDVAGINYAEARYALDAKQFPHRILVGSETFPSALDRIWPLVLEHPTVIGDFAWTAWDYIGEASLGRAFYADDADAPQGMSSPYPWMLAQSGTIDTTGTRRPISYWQETVWGLRTEPYIAVHRPEHYGRDLTKRGWSWDDALSSWSWSNAHGAPVLVDVYSDADEVELLLDGTSLGRAAVGDHKACIARFETTYRPGELTAIAHRHGQETGRTSLRTRQDEVAVSVDVDRTQVRADGTDLAFVQIALTDADGVLANDLQDVVTVQVEGPAVLAGLGSAQPDSTEPFDSHRRTTYDGRALAIIRPTGPGTILVKVTATDHRGAEVTITAE